jgi:hypothetical protein
MIYLGMGGKELGDDPKYTDENKQFEESLGSFQKWLEERKINAKAVVDDEAQHNEGAWAERLPGALKMLFGAK